MLIFHLESWGSYHISILKLFFSELSELCIGYEMYFNTTCLKTGPKAKEVLMNIFI